MSWVSGCVSSKGRGRGRDKSLRRNTEYRKKTYGKDKGNMGCRWTNQVGDVVRCSGREFGWVGRGRRWWLLFVHVLSRFDLFLISPEPMSGRRQATTGIDRHRQATTGLEWDVPPKDYLMLPSDIFVCGLGAIGAVGMVRWWSVRLVGDCHCRWMSLCKRHV